MAKSNLIHVQVVWVDAQNRVQEQNLELPNGASLQDALRECELSLSTDQACGVWGRQTSLNHRLKDGDRVERYQPLKVDPKVARRERFAQQGARGAGLFARRRAHSKAGY